MPRHQDALVSFEVPRDWEDRTMVAYSAPREKDAATSASVVMTRDRLDEGTTIEAYLDRQLDTLARKLDGFILRERGPAGASFTSQVGGAPVEQRLVAMPAGAGRVIAFTLTAPRGDAAQLAPLFDRILGSVRLAEATR